jgi:hypothetical protein
MEEKKGYTLWEKWTGKDASSARTRLEDTLANPLQLHCGDYVTAEILEGNDRPFTIAEVREYTREISRDTFRFADYVLRQGDQTRILRANPKQGMAGGQECDLLWLKLYYEMQFDAGVRDAVTQNQFNVDSDDDGTPDVVYDALNAGAEGYLARVQNAQAGQGALTSHTLRYWDFYRKGDPKKNEIEGEDVFLFVEIDEGDGYTVMLEGTKISGGDIQIYPAGDTHK